MIVYHEGCGNAGILMKKWDMDTHTVITYEVIEPVSNERFFTKSRFEALDHYEQGSMVYERHETITQPSMHTQTQVRVVLHWHGDPKKYEV